MIECFYTDGFLAVKFKVLSDSDDRNKKSRLILVPAAAVIREGQALSKITGRKASVDGIVSSSLNLGA